MPDLIPPSAALLPPAPALRERLAVALREVDLLRRLIRAADSVRPYPVTTGDRLPTPGSRKGVGNG
ncbi:MAG TPA: hypothetical protein VH092_06850 [Urbifossiella sp.]|jgi:hypothetical protein|nr:hypothetical protein [Urbifossiella sp.]